MAAILQTTFWIVIFFDENYRSLIKISLKFVSTGTINNMLALVLMIARYQIGNKPLFELMMA